MPLPSDHPGWVGQRGEPWLAYAHDMLLRCHHPPFPISPEDVCHDITSANSEVRGRVPACPSDFPSGESVEGLSPGMIHGLPPKWEKTYQANNTDELLAAYADWASTYDDDSIISFGYAGAAASARDRPT